MEEKIETLLEYLEEKKAKEISLFDVREEEGNEQYIVLANFSTCLENKSFASDFMQRIEITEFPEGFNKGEWIIFMLDDVILHTFIPVKREKYNLDKLYQNNKVNLNKAKKTKKV